MKEYKFKTNTQLFCKNRMKYMDSNYDPKQFNSETWVNKKDVKTEKFSDSTKKTEYRINGIKDDQFFDGIKRKNGKYFTESRDEDVILQHYLIAGLWSSMDDEDEPLDRNYDISDIDRRSIQKAKNDIKNFIRQAGSLLNGLDLEQVGHDFWLTRNGHGTGFWDRDYDDASVGDALTKIAKRFGESYIYVGDDGIVYID